MCSWVSVSCFLLMTFANIFVYSYWNEILMYEKLNFILEILFYILFASSAFKKIFLNSFKVKPIFYLHFFPHISGQKFLA